MFKLFHGTSRNRQCRWIILLGTAILLFEFIYFFKTKIALSLAHDFKWLPQSIVAGLIVAPFAFLLWFWRDQNKIKDQEHIERDLKIKENNAEWDNFFKFQRIVTDKNESATVRATAIYAIGEYYTRSKESNFPQQTHQFFQALLNDPSKNAPINNEKCLMEGKDPKTLELTIQIIRDAIYNVIKQKMNYIRENEMDFNFFDLHGARFNGANLTMINISKCEIRNSDLRNAIFQGANLTSSNLSCSRLDGSDLRYAVLSEADLKGAVIYGTNLSGVLGWEKANWTSARFNNETIFPDGMREKTIELGMRDFGNINKD